MVCRIAAQRQKYPMHRPRKVRHTMLSKLERGRTKVVQRPSRFIACVATAATFLRISSYFQTFFLLSVPSPYFPQRMKYFPLTRIASSSGYNNRDICVYIEQIPLIYIYRCIFLFYALMRIRRLIEILRILLGFFFPPYD